MNNDTAASRKAENGPKAVLEKINALRDLIESHAAADEEATQPSDDVLAGLEESGLFQIMAPRELGGLEAHPSQVIDALRAVAYFDGSTGWYCQAATTGPAVAGAFLGERAIDAIFCSGGRATCSGMAAPIGKAERVGDGYRISGTFSFGSGIPSASWVVGGYTLYKDGTPVLRENGMPITLIALAPRSKVEILGNWNVLGLRASGSYDFRVEEQIVHSDFAFDSGNPVPLRGGPLYRMGFLAIPHLCHASFGLGCARRALDEWVTHARSKKRFPTGTIGEMETFQKDIALSHTKMRAAEAYVRKSYDNAFDTAAKGASSGEIQLDVKLSASHVIAAAAEVSQLAFTSCATTGLRNGSMIQRCFRDTQAGNAHILTAEQAFIAAGKYIAGLPGAEVGL